MILSSACDSESRAVHVRAASMKERLSTVFRLKLGGYSSGGSDCRVTSFLAGW